MSETATELRPNGTPSLDDIIALWQRLLQFSPIGPDDDFFDLGGDSLLALHLFHEIERVAGRALPITAIYDAATPARLVDLLGRAAPTPFSPLVLLKPGRAEPLFIAHGLGGTVMELERLGRLIDTPRPVYAIQAKGVDGGDEPLDRVEDMVAYYLTAVRNVQPHGPYFLSGYSFGGLVAMELARHVREEGETVALLAFVDSFAHPRTFPKAARHIVRLRVILATFRTMPFRQACAFILARVKRQGGAASRPGLVLSNFPAAANTVALRKVYDAAFTALWNYRPRPYPGPVVFFRPATSIFPVAPARIWRPLVGRLDMRRVGTGHESLVRNDAPALAAALAQALRDAEAK
jgi:acetoacetyl-CoA synthetase